MHLKTWRMKRSHTHLRDSLPFHNLQAQIFLLGALKMRRMLVMWQVNSHNPLSGYCPRNPKSMQCTPFLGPSTRKSNEAAHITRESTPLRVLLLFFVEIITQLVVETNFYYHQFLDNSDDGPSPQCEVKEAEMFAFLTLSLQMGHTVHVRLEDYWMKMEQFC